MPQGTIVTNEDLIAATLISELEDCVADQEPPSGTITYFLDFVVRGDEYQARRFLFREMIGDLERAFEDGVYGESLRAMLSWGFSNLDVKEVARRVMRAMARGSNKEAEEGTP